MQVEETPLEGVLLITPRVFKDERGFFLESYHQPRFAELGIALPFVQDNLSRSVGGTLRGLHFQIERPQGKLVQVLEGEIFDVAVDLRVGSATFGEWFSATLSADNHCQFYLPPGFGHGFCVTSETALVAYKCTDVYTPSAERTVRWDDPDIAVDWPVGAPILSEKDAVAPLLAELGSEDLFRYQP